MFDSIRPRRSRAAALLAVALAALTAGALVQAAVAGSFALKVNRHAKIVDVTGHTSHAAAVVNAHGLVVYILTGDSRHHPQCTSKQCLKFWPPVTVKSARRLTKAPGIRGHLAVWRHHGFNQVTIDGHPLYTFAPDKRGVATGQGIKNFGGTWLVRLANGHNASASASAPAPAPTPSGSGSGNPPAGW